jgi:hypothetical protein
VADEIVIGATKRSLVVTLEDEDGNAIDLGATGSAKLQGHSGELPDDDLDEAMTVTNAGSGEVTLLSLGTLVAEADLVDVTITSATYRCRVKYTDSAGLIDWGTAFDLTWVLPPILTPVTP